MRRNESGAGVSSAQFNKKRADETSAPHSSFVPLDKSAPIEKSARRLPHWHQAGVTYFVTFRLADSMPHEKLRKWQEEKRIWLSFHTQPLSVDDQTEFNKRFVEKLQVYLDAGYGSCVLAQSAFAVIVRDALHHFDGQRYDLGEYVMMPNHVHLLVSLREGFEVSTILQGWKGFTAKQINQHLGAIGTVWLDESFDHIVRSWEQLQFYEGYIRENPVKAGLRPGTYLLGCGNAPWARG